MLSQNGVARRFGRTLLISIALSGAAAGGTARAPQEQQAPPSAPPQRRLHHPTGAPTPPPAQDKKPAAPSPLTPPPASAPGRQAPDDGEDVVRVETDLTSILLTAVDKDKRFMTTLRQEDIRLLEDRVPQQIQIFQRETDLPLSLAILVDTSDSQTNVLPDEKAAASAFVDAVVRPEKDRAAIISFTGEARSEQALTNDPARLRTAIDRIRVEFSVGSPECDPDNEPTDEQLLRCSTGVWDAVWITVNEVLSQTPERTRRAIILLTDGDDTSSQTKKQEAIDFAVKHNAVVYAIGIRDRDFPYGKLDRDALRKVSEKTGGRAFFPVGKAELNAAFAQIEAELRSQYLVAYSPANKRRDGAYRQVQIEIVNPALRKQKLRLLYRQGYFAKSVAR